MRASHIVAWGLLAVVLTGAMVLGFRPSSRPQPDPLSLPAESLPILFEAPEFSLTERSGRTVNRAHLLGRVWVADFIFTFCAGPCPVMTQKMAELERELKNEPRARLVSFTVDPARDTPEVLSTYAARFGADVVRWLFLTGDEADVRRLAIDGFKIVARSTSDDERQQGMDDILHSQHFVLIDARGRVRGVYDSTDAQRMAQLPRDVRRLAAEAR